MERLISKERYNHYDIEIWGSVDTNPTHPVYYYKVIAQSEDQFESAERAKFAAVGHIALLENEEK